PNVVFFYWLKLLYLFEVILIGGGILLAAPEVQKFGITALVVTVILHLIVLTLQDTIKGNNFSKLIKILCAIFIAGLAITGIFFFYLLFSGNENLWKDVSELQKTFNDPKSALARFEIILLFAAPIFLVFVYFIWHEIISQNIRQVGLAVIFFAVSL